MERGRGVAVAVAGAAIATQGVASIGAASQALRTTYARGRGGEGRSAEGRRDFRAGRDAQEQVEDLENAQRGNRSRGQPDRIQETKKSEQRLDNELKRLRNEEDAIKEFGDE